MRPQDYGEKTLDTLHEPANAYITGDPPPYDFSVQVCLRIPWLSICEADSVHYVTWPRGYKTFFVLNSVEHEILNAH